MKNDQETKLQNRYFRRLQSCLRPPIVFRSASRIRVVVRQSISISAITRTYSTRDGLIRSGDFPDLPGHGICTVEQMALIPADSPPLHSDPHPSPPSDWPPFVGPWELSAPHDGTAPARRSCDGARCFFPLPSPGGVRGRCGGCVEWELCALLCGCNGGARLHRR
jgi:hypothetical protein